jgi:hypothetical protein
MALHKQKRLVRLGSGLLLATVPLVILASIIGSTRKTEVAVAAPLQQAGVPQIGFVSPSVSVNENVATGVATIFVQMDITSSVPVTVAYLTVAGTASAGLDYASTSGILTFTVSAVAPQTQSFVVPIIDDLVDEPNETINLILRNPFGAILGAVDTAVLTITDNDPPPTATPTPTSGAPPVFLDAYEPNNTVAAAFTTAANAADLCNITLWPVGDVDFFKFWGRAGSYYEVSTKNLDPGLDTVMSVLDSQGNVIGSNDDAQPGTRASLVSFTAGATGFYYARIVNQDPTNPANKTYCLGILESQPPTPSPTVTGVPLTGDSCEFNSTFATACLIGAGETKSLDFVPSLGSSQDTDVFRLWVKPDIEYTCETDKLSSVNDTNIILFDTNGNPFVPPIGNDDKAHGDLGSKVTYLSTYTGWLFIMVGPVNPPPFADADQYTYELTCDAVAATATPTRRPPLPPSGGTGSGTATPTPTPIIFPTFPPSPTPIDLSQFSTPVPVEPPIVSFDPLPTQTPVGAGEQIASVNITLYYDENENFTPEATEGIVDVAVALYDNSSGRLIQFGNTNEAGALNFGSIAISGAVRIEVPFLNYSQIVLGPSSNILLRVAPQPLPNRIP